MKLPATLPARLRASAIHFALSLAVFLVLLSLIVYVWYPDALFWVDGGVSGVQILIAVDLVLGPLLTLIIYNPTKTRRHIVMDFMLIAAIQVGALAWGVNTIYDQKPLALVFDGSAFQVVDKDYLEKQQVDIGSLNREGAPLPLIYYARKPQTTEEGAGVVIHLFINSLPEWAVVTLFDPLKLHMAALQAASDKVKRRYRDNELVMARYHSILSGNPLTEDDSLLLPLSGRFGDGLIVLDQSGAVLGSFRVE
ncbi:MAG: hypothetical protein L3J62_05960 [Gammaproteobacteria bacterium]|nr:hypothetical protein [Gammaproteobacteria bacterium]MCF6230323.1 hypothetical protein [Gammaproteobacteria bacterium]